MNRVMTSSTLVAWLALFCDYLLMTVIIPLFPVLHRTEFETAMLFSVKAVLQVIFAPIFSKVIDKYGLRLLLGGIVVDIISTLYFATTVDYTTWFIGRAVQGVASAAVIPAANGHIQRIYADNDEVRGQAFGWVISGIIAGVMLGPPLGGVLFQIHPAVPFLVIALVLTITACLTLYLVVTLDVPPVENTEQGFEKIINMLRDDAIMVTVGALFFANAGISALEATFGSFGMKYLGLDTAGVGLMYMWTTVPTIIASAIVGPYMHTIGFDRHSIVKIGLVMQGAFFALGPKHGLFLNVISFMGTGFGMGLIDGTCPAINSEVSARRHGGSTAVQSLATTAIQLGFIAGPVVGSFLMGTFSFWGMSFILGFLMVAYAPKLDTLTPFHHTHTDNGPYTSI
eukprot:TRINITY_DN2274_c0_g1_i1.p1 TRINITY_DN2274_c0_g1~~TRINITY_DN2274_c0_g1_i1.p1  ORF type:complete len:412 (+),score=60.66 TRINITY_DN2274_c0_g1_i1:43-1236(+)